MQKLNLKIIQQIKNINDDRLNNQTNLFNDNNDTKKSDFDYIKSNTDKWTGLNYENGFFFLDDSARLLADEIASDLFI